MSNKRSRSNRSTKINGGKVLEGLAQGHNQREIAQNLQVHPSSVGRWLNKIKPYFQELEDISINRGNTFNFLHAKSLKIQNEVLDELERIIEENSKKDPSQRMKLGSVLYALRGLGMNASSLYDSLRLEGGQSTSNIGIAGLINHAHQVSPFDPKTGEFKASLMSVVEKKASKDADALLSQDDNVENAVQVVENKGERERDVG